MMGNQDNLGHQEFPGIVDQTEKMDVQDPQGQKAPRDNQVHQDSRCTPMHLEQCLEPVRIKEIPSRLMLRLQLRKNKHLMY